MANEEMKNADGGVRVLCAPSPAAYNSPVGARGCRSDGPLGVLEWGGGSRDSSIRRVGAGAAAGTTSRRLQPEGEKIVPTRDSWG
jgi:hypothetical protein